MVGKARIVFSLAAFLLVGRGLRAQDSFREKFREKIKARILKKLQNMPAPETNASVGDKIAKAGDYTFAVPLDGRTRMYMVHVPTGFNPATPAPLIVAIHGGGGDMGYMANDRYYGLVSKSDKEGFVVVFPNGVSKFKSGKLATWNGGACCGQARDENVDDVGFIKLVVKNVSDQMSIDRRKVFAAGMSNGGIMAHRLACEAADTFKAIASVTGTDNTSSCRPSRPVSILHIHAKNDDHVLFNGGAGKGSFKDESKVTNFTSVPETIARWVKRDRCAPAPKRVLEKTGAYCDLYSPCAGNTQVKLCVTETGKHSWPGGEKPRGDEPPSNAIIADDEIWDFFKTL